MIDDYFEKHGVTLLNLYHIGIYTFSGIRISGCVLCVDRHIGIGLVIDVCSSIAGGYDGESGLLVGGKVGSRYITSEVKVVKSGVNVIFN